MNKKLLSAIILISGLITLISFSLSGAYMEYSNVASNDTYVDFNTTVKLTAEINLTDWYDVSHIDISAFVKDPSGITTNMTAWADGCCFFISDLISKKIIIVDTSGGNPANVSLPAAISLPEDVWVNASGGPVTDYWVPDRTDDWIYHLSSDGSISSDPTGNFSTAGCQDWPSGLFSNVSSGVPTTFFSNYYAGNVICVYNATGYNVENITLQGISGHFYGLTSYDQDRPLDDFWITETYFNRTYHCDKNGNNYVRVYANLSTNETGTWLNYTTSSRIASYNEYINLDNANVFNPTAITTLKGASEYTELIIADADADEIVRFVWGGTGTSKWANFTWENPDLECNNLVGWRTVFTDASGNQNITPINTFYHIPYINSTSYASSKITSATCADKNNITLTFATTPAGRVSVIMPFVYFDSTAECAYEGSEGTRIEIFNGSDHCWVRLNHSSLSSGDTIKIYPTKKLRVEPPPNLPAALTAAAVGLIIVIYVIVSKEEES